MLMTRPSSHALVSVLPSRRTGAAPLCFKCNQHRDANVHIAQHGYANHHAYDDGALQRVPVGVAIHIGFTDSMGAVRPDTSRGVTFIGVRDVQHYTDDLLDNREYGITSYTNLPGWLDQG